ncbi:MAG TPA: glucosyl-3-phosphoglycerate synthase [Chloroflexota bacterium]|jgi:glucosyl-3-phosphoglycerate synthase|nr:glucosyl-3-phosphoglycerate synthase [Chloroflexota bacterium]
MSSGLTLVPIVPGVSARNAIEIARAMASSDTSKAVVLSIVEVPEERSLSEGVSIARRRREVLRRLGVDGDALDTVEFAVRAARSLAEGVREAVAQHDASNLVLTWRGPFRSEVRLRRSSLDSLILNPPCDLTVFRTARPPRSEGSKPEANLSSAIDASSGGRWPPKRILVPVRGGLHADLAIALARRLAHGFGGDVTVLRIDPRNPAGVNTQPTRTFTADHEYVLTVSSDSISTAIATEAELHDLLILGASARGPRSTHLFGMMPEHIADMTSTNVMIVKTAEMLSTEMFGVAPPQIHSVSTAPKASISTVVDQWFAENTFHSHEFADLDLLMRRKEHQGISISVALPALNEAATIGKIISTIKQRMMQDVPLVDELVVIDSNSDDETRSIAESMGVPVFIHREILPHLGTYVGKGEGLWKSLYVTKGDIVVWIDSDITDIHPKFVYGLVGPLLTEPRVEFVKGYYRRPLKVGGEMLTTGGGRVTELTARPLINLFYPHLSGLVQPLAGEMAGRRSLLERLPFFTGYGVETGLLIDIIERFGLDVLAQTDLENRIHRNQDMISLSKMAFAIVQVVMRRLEGRQHIRLLEDINTTMKLIHYSPEELFLEVKEIEEFERPPMIELPEYHERITGIPKPDAIRA